MEASGVHVRLRVIVLSSWIKQVASIVGASGPFAESSPHERG